MRPKENLKTFPKDWQSKILSLYQKGASDNEIKALITEWKGTFSNDLWSRWMDEEKEFSETIKKGRILSQAFWERVGRENLSDKNFNYIGWFMNMRNRFGWSNNSDKTTTKPEVKYTHSTFEFIDEGDDLEIIGFEDKPRPKKQPK